ncbi:MAG: PAS domain-containing protein, partial [Pseudomonadota bacterium]|nr:PAS domain-containing protein [Pseudomonadota bacterium]
RYTAVVEDRSIEEERDLAQMQIGTLMGTAEVGIATFQESSGWVRQRLPEGAASGSPAAASVLQNISRELVATESLADYETLQRALRNAEPADVRYAIEHPELGRRWLHTRVEPARLASGKRTTSVVTLDITDRLQTKARSEQLLREMTTILESTTAGIAYLRGGVLVRCNRCFETMLGWERSAPVGSSLATLLAAHDASGGMAAAIAAALLAGQTYENEFAAAGAAGSGSRWYALSVRSAGSGSAADEAIAVLTDVSRLKAQQHELETLARDRQLAEQAVAQQAARTRSILDSVLVGIVIVGPDGIEWMNRSARRMFGGDLADFLGQPIAVVATPDATHPFRQSYHLDELAAGQAETFECTLRARDGREFRVVGNAVATDDGGGGGGGGRQLTYALLDIERRRQAEAAVTQAQASLRRVIEAAPLAIALLDAATLEVVQVNAVAAETVGARPEALVGKPPEAIFPAVIAAARRHDMQTALAAADVSSFEYRFVRNGRSEVWDARYLPLSDGAGARPDQLLLVATDVSAQRAAEAARFAEAIAQRDMLVKEVHHRIKNNLQGVAGLLQQIAQRKPEVSGVIDEVVGQVQAIAQVYGLQVGTTGPLPLVGVFEAIAGSVQRTFGVAIACEVHGDAAAEWTLPEVEAIPIALTLNELLTNAVKHSPVAGAAIACRLDTDAEEVRVSISNRARLPSGFNLLAIPNGVSGLGLVRALMPRRSASLSLEQRGDRVEAVVSLRPPGVVRHCVAPTAKPAP